MKRTFRDLSSLGMRIFVNEISGCLLNITHVRLGWGHYDRRARVFRMIDHFVVEI